MMDDEYRIIIRNRENRGFWKMWPFKKKSIQRISIYVETLEPAFRDLDPNALVEVESRSFMINDEDPIFDQTYEMIDKVMKVYENNERSKVEQSELEEYNRLKSKYG